MSVPLCVPAETCTSISPAGPSTVNVPPSAIKWKGTGASM